MGNTASFFGFNSLFETETKKVEPKIKLIPEDHKCNLAFSPAIIFFAISNLLRNCKLLNKFPIELNNIILKYTTKIHATISNIWDFMVIFFVNKRCI